MLAEMLRIRSAQALDDYRVRLTLTDGETIERDLRALLWGPVFQPLRDDYDRFRQVCVEAGTLVWPGDLDFDPDTLIWGGAPPTAPASKPPKFLRLESPRPSAEA
jgi:hypothetical protein